MKNSKKKLNIDLEDKLLNSSKVTMKILNLNVIQKKIKKIEKLIEELKNIKLEYEPTQ